MPKYDHIKIEEKWQKRWREKEAGRCEESADKQKFYLLEMFPYPSGKIHMGHVRNYSIGDVYARYLKMKGLNLLHPMGWDAFGLPAENAAINHGVHPKIWTERNIKNMRAQLERLGFLYDWRREVTTCSPEYYKWEQLFFLKMFDRGLAYRKFSYVNFCPNCNTVLANEQVIEGRCWRCEGEVISKGIEGWFLRITAYAEKLLQNLETLRGGWPERVLVMQKNWIGKSEGSYVSFPIEGRDEVIEIFTTRIDTIFGATFISLAPEYPGILDFCEPSRRGEVSDFIEKCRNRRKVRRDLKDDEKEGVWTGRFCINPFNGEKLPLYVANFVLIEYGTGAVMAVPAHDQRDFEFAKRYGIPIRVVIVPEGQKDEVSRHDPSYMKEAFTEDGICINSGRFDGLPSSVARVRMTEFAKEKGFGRFGVQYRLRDWGISRQRYWGAPIPVIHCPRCGIVKVPEDQLPVTLPMEIHISKMEVPPLSMIDEFVKTKCPSCSNDAFRETDTMDTFVESSWYFLRFTSLNSLDAPFDPASIRYWMPVDQYIGGIEHAVLHLLYARFFTMVLKDLGYIDFEEPFKRLLTQGMVTKDGAKMSKSKGNVVDPDEIIREYGADTTRLFLLFASPPEKDLDWSFHGIQGCYRFLNRFFNLAYEIKRLAEEDAERETNGTRGELQTLPEDPSSIELLRSLHRTIKKVSEGTGERFQFNTAIAAIMEFVNMMGDYLRKGEVSPSLLLYCLKTTNLLLSPYVPHICDEILEILGEEGLCIEMNYPTYDPNLVESMRVAIAVQINGKVRGEITIEKGTPEEKVREIALQEPKISRFLQGKSIKKCYYIENRLISFVV